jgi:cellulose synthase/poly-beta-1,6-N-acetylglucosamine synthase-like glycosyltransferase
VSDADAAILGGYLCVITILSIYGWHRSYLVYLYRRHRLNRPGSGPLGTLPSVTVQLPIYNEIHVVERLLQSVGELDYPKALLQIQVLDDSTDETQSVAQRAVRQLASGGLDISYHHRSDRSGFKAGALEAGLSSASGDFIAIFDADFRPPANFLRAMLPYFYDGGVGLVQARWGHANEQQSLLTRLQSLQLDGHFFIEHGARSRSGLFFNFNGTAGIWRRTAIATSGGWQHDTLTEDVDLSYRAQLAGWRFVFLPDVVVPGEVPAEMNSFKVQQYRWAKGSTQVCLKLLPRIFHAPLPVSVKVEAFFHLTAYWNSPLLLLLSMSLFPALYATHASGGIGWVGRLHLDLIAFLTATLSFANFYTYAMRELHPAWLARLRFVPAIMALAIGMSLNNSAAIVAALLGKTGDFTRTSKSGATGTQRRRTWLKSYSQRAPVHPLIEIAIGLYMSVGVIYALAIGAWSTVPFLILFLFGFLYTGTRSIAELGGRGLVRRVLNVGPSPSAHRTSKLRVGS